MIVDLHVHSHYSYATSKQMNILDLYRWGKLKGIDVIGTGDCLHPQYLAELEDQLISLDNGLFTLESNLANLQNGSLPESLLTREIAFMLTVEVSCIYRRHDRLRKVHHVITFPDFKAVKALIKQLERVANLRSDGRPTLGMDSYDLLQKILEIDSRCLFIPAHVWTPWFGLFGSKSGFDTLEEAFDDLVPQVSALETGLSSDPPMNWSWSHLDGKTLVSNSDAHSPVKLGREANLINAPARYQDIAEVITSGDERFVGTIEFFPQEGKYHLDGHRACKVCLNPDESKDHKNLCLVCGRELTIGVLNRVQALADRPLPSKDQAKKAVEYIVPLLEIIGESLKIKSIHSKQVQSLYEKLLEKLGDEFSILRKVPLADIAKVNQQVAQAIHNMRLEKVHISPGYDGVFGRVKLLKQHSPQPIAKNLSLFEI